METEQLVYYDEVSYISDEDLQSIQSLVDAAEAAGYITRQSS